MKTQSDFKFQKVESGNHKGGYFVTERATNAALGYAVRHAGGWRAFAADGGYVATCATRGDAALDLQIRAHVAETRTEVKPLSWEAPGSARCETCLCRRIDDGTTTRYIEGPTTVEALASATGDSDGPMYIAIAGQDVGTCAALGWASLSIHPYVLAEDADAATAHHMAAQRAGHDDIHVRQVR